MQNAKLKIYALIVLVALAAAAPAHAQFLGYASPQTVSKQVLNNPTFTCDGSNNAYDVDNLGQSQHYVAYRFLSGPGQNIGVGIEGSMDGTNWLPISDVASNQPSGAVAGSGYYPAIRVSVLCTGGGTVSLTVNYSGTSVANGLNAGVNDFGAYQKVLWQLTAASAGVASEITPTPYGNTSGVIYIKYTAAGPGGSTIDVHCNTPSGDVEVLAATAVATTGGVTQTFIIPSLPCSDAVATYTAGGASATTVSASYLFSKPGAASVVGGPAANVNVTNNPLNVNCVSGCAGGGGTQDVNLAEVGGVAVALGQTTESASIPVVLANDAPAEVNLNLFGSTPVPGLGQFVMANSLPVAIASDQSDLNVNIVAMQSVTDPCNDPFTIPASELISGSGASAVIIAGVGGQSIFVCGVSWNYFDATTTTAALLVSGTGSTCLTGLSAFTEILTAAVATSVGQSYSRPGTIFRAPVADDICVLITSPTGQATGMINYVQQ